MSEKKKIFYLTDENGKTINALDKNKQLNYAYDMSKKLAVTCEELVEIYEKLDEEASSCCGMNEHRLVAFFGAEKEVYVTLCSMIIKLQKEKNYIEEKALFIQHVEQRLYHIGGDNMLSEIDNLRADRVLLKKELEDSLSLFGVDDMFKLDEKITYSSRVFDKVAEVYNGKAYADKHRKLNEKIGI